MVELHDQKGLQAAFTSSYALVGILLADDVEQVLRMWEGAQEEVRELKNATPALRDNDAYLAIIVPTIDAHTDRLNAVLDNTYVCRKVCVEIDGKTIPLCRQLHFTLLMTVDKSAFRKDESKQSFSES
jgi:hypothetical protein